MRWFKRNDLPDAIARLSADSCPSCSFPTHVPSLEGPNTPLGPPVGTCPMLLCKASPDREMGGVLMHETAVGEVVCEKAGFIEPITLSMFKFLSTEGQQVLIG